MDDATEWEDKPGVLGNRVWKEKVEKAFYLTW